MLRVIERLWGVKRIPELFTKLITWEKPEDLPVKYSPVEDRGLAGDVVMGLVKIDCPDGELLFLLPY